MSTDHDELKKDSVTRPTGRRYTSVKELMAQEGVPIEVQNNVSEIKKATSLVKLLCQARVAAGITQEEMAKGLNTTQPTISKLETGRDDELTVGEIEGYSKVLGKNISVIFGEPLTDAEGVKMHALAMRRHLLSLAKTAHRDEEIEKEVQAFFGEAFFNLLNILVTSSQQLPHASQFEVRMIVEDTPVPTPRISAALREKNLTIADC